VGKTPILKENLTRDNLSAMSAITLDGKLYMTEQERTFKGEDAVRFLKHLKCVKLKNLCCQSIAQLKVELRKAKERLRHNRLHKAAGLRGLDVCAEISNQCSVAAIAASILSSSAIVCSPSPVSGQRVTQGLEKCHCGINGGLSCLDLDQSIG